MSYNPDVQKDNVNEYHFILMNSNKIKTFFFSFLFFITIFSLTVFSLDPKKPIHQNMQSVWTSDLGLPSDYITSVLQDSDGFIWIGTYNGLVKFEGVKFELFTHHTRTDFKSNSATFLYEDSKKKLWIGTNGDGLACYNDHKFTMYTTENGLLSNYINAISEDDKGNILIGTRKGVVSLDTHGKISVMEYNGKINEPVNGFYKDREGNVFSLIGKGGIYKLSQNEIKPSIYNQFVQNYEVMSIFIDKYQKTWIGTKNNGLFVFENGKLNSLQVLDNIKVKTINKLRIGEDGCVWICSDSGLFRSFDGNISSYTEKSGLSNNQVNDYFEDREGNGWIATSRGGLVKLSEGKFYSISSRHGLVHKTVNAIMNDRDGYNWIGTDKGLSLYKDGRFFAHPLVKKLSRIRIRHIMQESTGKIWICSYSNLGVITFLNGKIKNYSTENGLSSNRCRFALEDKGGKVWIGTANGLNSLVNNKIKTYSKKDGLKDNYIMSLFRDSKENIWIGTNGGGASYFKNNSIHSYSTEDGLASDIVFSFFEDSKGVLWFATSEGLSRYSNDVFINYTVEQGLFGNAVFQILEDRRGKFWMTSEIGIFTAELNDMNEFAKGKLKKIKMKLYNSMDGLPGSSTPVSWAAQNAEDQIWFPTLKGVGIVNTLDLTYNQYKPPVLIKDINIDGRKYSPGNSIVLKPDYKRITIDFTGLSFVIPNRVKFSYFLEGFDDKWSDISYERYASYTSLPPGKYTFKVIAVNNDGLWNKDGAILNIKQEPFYYQTVWFVMVLLFLFLISVFIIYKLRTRSLRRNRLKLKKKVLERTGKITIQKEQIEQKNIILESQKKQLTDSQIELEAVNKILSKLSITDSLTGISNRRKFDEFLLSEWKRSIRLKKPISIIMIDVDYFKSYNDEYGHQAGDRCLKLIAEALSKSIHRSIDLIARYGGEEFAAILPDSDMRSALTIAKRIKSEVIKLNIEHRKSFIESFVTVSIGVATEIPLVDDDFNILINIADEALYQAKTNGRNRISF